MCHSWLYFNAQPHLEGFERVFNSTRETKTPRSKRLQHFTSVNCDVTKGTDISPRSVTTCYWCGLLPNMWKVQQRLIFDRKIKSDKSDLKLERDYTWQPTVMRPLTTRWAHWGRHLHVLKRTRDCSVALQGFLGVALSTFSKKVFLRSLREPRVKLNHGLLRASPCLPHMQVFGA